MMHKKSAFYCTVLEYVQQKIQKLIRFSAQSNIENAGQSRYENQCQMLNLLWVGDMEGAQEKTGDVVYWRPLSYWTDYHFTMDGTQCN